MTVFTIEADWGETLDFAVRRYRKRTGEHASVLFTRVGRVTGDSRNTIAKLVNFADEPENWKDRARAVALVLAIGEEPQRFGLSVDDLPRAWDLNRVRAALGAEYAPRDSNPEPAD